MTYDPLEGLQGTESTLTAEYPDPDPNSKSPLVKRAEKRVVRHVTGKHWVVVGDEKLGDSFDSYNVAHDDAGYHCDCFKRRQAHGARKKMCSHAMAVVLWRRKGENRAKERMSGGEEEIGSPEARIDSPLPDPNAVDASLSPTDPSLTPQAWAPPPSWLTEYRPHQIVAAREIVDAFMNGARVVYCEAPTGSGKSVIADLVSRMMRTRALIVCTSKQLQDQYLESFPYACVLKGRQNYPTQLQPFPEYTAEDCDRQEDDCSYCAEVMRCEYRVQKQKAIRAQMTVLNTAYFLREANGPAAFSRPMDDEGKHGGLLIIDECDTLEKQLMGFIEYVITKGRCRDLGVRPPNKGSHHTTIARWLQEDLIPAIQSAKAKLGFKSIADQRKRRAYESLIEESARIAAEVVAEDDARKAWVRDNALDNIPLSMKPVQVGAYGEEKVWRHAGHVLMMSASIVSVDELNESLGQEHEYGVVRVPSTFPAENRPIHYAGVAAMTYKNRDEAWPMMARAVERILLQHEGERVLVHTVSYAFNQYLMNALREHNQLRRVLVTYDRASERLNALDWYRSTPGAVLLAPSFDRGVDLKDDDCRVQIVTKMPQANLRDAQVGARLRMKDGDGWYTVQTVRTLIQMTGRGVRHEDDTCVTYILDAQFRKLWRENRALLPEWWREAVNMEYPVRPLIRE